MAIAQDIVNDAIQSVPDWTKSTPVQEIDANALLDDEQNPLAVAFTKLKNLKEKEFIAILSDFRPEPLIDEFIGAGYEVYCQEVESNSFVTYVKK